MGIKVSQPLHLKVLLVEDDLANAQYVQRALRIMGCQVTVADSGETALKLYQEGHHQLILLDIRLPQMDGVEFLKIIRAQEFERGQPPVPIEVLTADAIGGRRQVCMAAGASGFMTKPIRPEKIYQALKPYAADTESSPD